MGDDMAAAAALFSIRKEEPPRSQASRLPPEKTRFGSCLTFIGLMVVLGACCAGVLGLWFTFSAEAYKETEEITRNFADNLVVGDYDAAYQHLCNSTRSRISEEEFVRQLSGDTSLDSYTLIIRVPSPAWRREVRANATFIDEAGERWRFDFTVMIEDGEWRICY